MGRGIMRRIVDGNVRLMSAGWNKLLEEWKARNNNLREKLKFVIKTLTDKDAAFTLMAYNQLKQRKLMLEGVGFGDDVATKLKIRLLRKLTDTGYNLQVMAANAIKEFLASERDREEKERLEFERQQKEKDRILRRIMDGNVRMMGTGFRQAFQWMEKARDEETRLMQRQRGIMRRIVDSNTRLMSAGYNKLIEEWKARGNMLKDKLKFVIKTLTDKDAAFMLAGYNGLKQRALMLNGVGMGDAEMKKIQLIKRLTNTGYNLQVMAVNALKEFLVSERDAEEKARLEFERQQKEKDRLLKRIMDGNVRMMGTAFRQAYIWMETEREKEIALVNKQRGIMRRIVDSNVRLMGAGWNKLLEQWKAQQNAMKEKLKFVIATLTDQDKQFLLMAYNGLKQRMQMLNGVGMSDAAQKK